MNNGWIKLHRKLLDNPLHNKPNWAWLWIVLLLLANHDEDHKFLWNGRDIILKKGQFVTGRKKLNEITGIPESTIERALNYLENGQQIGQQKSNKYRLITILNWETYQNVDSKTDNKRTTNGHIQEYKELKNNTIAGINPVQKPFSLLEEIKKLDDSPRRDLNIISLFFEEKKPDIRNKEQLSVAIKRHLRPAQNLIPFTNNQIVEAIPKAKKLTNEWTLETLVKLLTK